MPRKILIALSLVVTLVLILALPATAFAWGPVTHIELGVQVLASVVVPGHTLRALLASLPEAFLYGSLAPDIVQGRRLHSRLRRHSHNWSTGAALLEAARTDQERSFAYGYLAHLAADVIAHNFFLPARFAGYYDGRAASHIYTEACFDTLCEPHYSDLLLTVLDLDFGALDAMMRRAIDSPMPFGAHRLIFASGLRRIREWHQVILATGGGELIPPGEARLFREASRATIAEILINPDSAACHRFDPMGTRAIRNALIARRYLHRVAALGAEARASADRLASAMLAEVLERLGHLAPTEPS
ncbi:MAG TPA: zinc dependent phospholipase C family protein [Candidatus Binataceae bacterium]|nr:zinc dependent phospholipase C family protein [Candidatus Binataceae bacterium]